MKSIYLLLIGVLLLAVAGCCQKTCDVSKKVFCRDTRNLLINSEFNFHPYLPHRTGRAVSFSADYVPFWNADTAKSLAVFLAFCGIWYYNLVR